MRDRCAERKVRTRTPPRWRRYGRGISRAHRWSGGRLTPGGDQARAPWILGRPSLVIYIAVELLRGLDYAHDLPVNTDGMRGVVHRDISPHNILLSWEGDVKVSDFGIAKARAATSATASEIIKGKPAYMSPEQARGWPLDGRSDVRLRAAAAVPRRVLRAVVQQRVPDPGPGERAGRDSRPRARAVQHVGARATRVQRRDRRPASVA